MACFVCLSLFVVGCRWLSLVVFVWLVVVVVVVVVVCYMSLSFVVVNCVILT